MEKCGIINTEFHTSTGVDTMDEFIKELDPNLDYLEHEINTDEVLIYVASNRKTCRCPYCNTPSGRVHSRYVAFKRNAAGNRVVERPAGYAPRSDSCFANGSGHIYASFKREQCLNCPHRAED